MTFYQHKMSPSTVKKFSKSLIDHLRQNATIVKELDDEEETSDEIFYLDVADEEKLPVRFYNILHALVQMRVVDIAQLEGSGVLLYYNHNQLDELATVTRTHVRLPRIHYLTLLTTHDFFTFFDLINGSYVQQGNALQINFGAAGVNETADSLLFRFFKKLRTNYRMEGKYCGKAWISYDDIATIADMPHTRDAQLSAIQLLAVLTNENTQYFPIESAIDLELNWRQLNHHYMAPPQERK